MSTVTTDLNREALADWYRRNRQRSQALFDLVAPDAYYARPISLRHPIVFYEGHLPAFSLNTLVKKGLGRAASTISWSGCLLAGSIPKTRLRPMAPDVRSGRRATRCVVSPMPATRVCSMPWRTRRSVNRGIRCCRSRGGLRDSRARGDASGNDALHVASVGYEQKRAPAGYVPDVSGRTPQPATVAIPHGRATLGARAGEIPFGWDNEFAANVVDVPAFADRRPQCDQRALPRFRRGGGLQNPEWWTPSAFAWLQQEQIEHPRFWARRDGSWQWRGMFEAFDLPPAWPVYVSQVEAAAYARWKGARLPTEAEYHRAAFAQPTSLVGFGAPGLRSVKTSNRMSDRTRGARNRRIGRAGTSTLPHGIRSPSAAAPRVRARGVCTT